MATRARTRTARQLRRNATEAEKRLWQALREAFGEHRFRRQHPIGQFIVDFANPQLKLVIELDGGQHAAQPDRDDERTAALARRGYRVIRFWNSEIMSNIEGVLAAISRELDKCR